MAKKTERPIAPLIHSYINAVLAENLRTISRLELYGGFEDLKLVGINSLDRDMPEARYEAVAKPEVYNRLKSALVEAGVVSRNAHARVIGPIQGGIDGRFKYLEMYFYPENLKVEVRVKKGK